VLMGKRNYGIAIELSGPFRPAGTQRCMVTTP
jgi:hypothetical protein